MASRYVSGETRPLRLPVDAARVVNAGDMVYLATDDVRSAAEFPWTTDLATTQAAFHDVYLGVALSSHGASDPAGELMVATQGLFEFDCDAATFLPGALVGPAKQTGNALESQKVAAVGGITLPTGRVAKHYASNTTKVLVEIQGVIPTGGIQAPA